MDPERRGACRFSVLLDMKNKVLKLKKYSLCWVPPPRNDDPKAARAEMAASMLSILTPPIAHARSWG
jgi:hypothetical protein